MESPIGIGAEVAYVGAHWLVQRIPGVQTVLLRSSARKSWPQIRCESRSRTGEATRRVARHGG